MAYPRIRVYVKNKHIDANQSKTSDLRSQACPVASAMRDAGFKNASVGGSMATFTARDGRIVNVHLSKKVQNFINSADAIRWEYGNAFKPLKPLKPFSILFEVRPFLI